ncbi:TRAP transporter substrate-binding protein [Futiania mangrovi]|uniref:TRAP transporter substrate-binding protein DctP n=1 Tax=Futiania mangrovi TaxID=2959716 RepID=A0A9J6P7Z1_9PROT|nr:TRAP transporter substrate-binding protein DctP [Futiania mangrovii]MCP1335492.1 TRAP transporter substrate-binding protein DctP [Futiania mangrovii]
MNMMPNWRLTGAAVALSAALAGSAAAETTWDLYAFTGVTHPITVRYQMFADEVAQATNGELKIIVRPAGELPFKATEVVKATSSGQVQLAAAYQGFISGAVPVASITSLPFLVQNADQLEQIAPKLIAAADAEFGKQGVRTLFWHTWPVQNIFGRGEPIRSLADFKGRKIRSTDGKQAEMLKQLGASSISLTTAEVPVAVERGVADGYITAAFNVVGAKWQEFTDWAWLCEVHIGGPSYLLMNIDAYNALPDDVRAKLDEVAKSFGPKFRALNLADEKTALESLEKEHGVTMVKPSDAEIAELIDRMTPYWETWATQNGDAAVKLLAEVRSELGK